MTDIGNYLIHQSRLLVLFGQLRQHFLSRNQPVSLLVQIQLVQLGNILQAFVAVGEIHLIQQRLDIAAEQLTQAVVTQGFMDDHISGSLGVRDVISNQPDRIGVGVIQAFGYVSCFLTQQVIDDMPWQFLDLLHGHDLRRFFPVLDHRVNGFLDLRNRKPARSGLVVLGEARRLFDGLGYVRRGIAVIERPCLLGTIPTTTQGFNLILVFKGFAADFPNVVTVLGLRGFDVDALFLQERRRIHVAAGFQVNAVR